MNEQEIRQMYERNVIVAILMKPENFAEAKKILRSEDFEDFTHRSIYSVFEELYQEGRTITPDKIISYFSKNSNIHEVIIDIVSGTFDYIDFLESCQKVKEMAKKQELLQINKDLGSLLESSDSIKIEDLEKFYQKTLERTFKEETEQIEDITDILDEIIERKKRYEEGKPFIEIDSGYNSLNQFTNGFHRGELTILAARPGMGKTALMLNMVTRQIKNGEKVMIFSLEMSIKSLVERMVAMLSGVDLQKIRRGNLTDEEFEDVLEAFDFLDEVKDNLIIFDKSNMTINEIKIEIRKQKDNVDIVYIDYLQLINSNSQYNNKNVEVGEVSRVAKVMARELGVAVVMLAQLSREVEKRTNRKPVLSDLRDSGEIEQNADIVLFLYRAAYYSDIGQEINAIEEPEIIIAKHRNGPTGSIKLCFKKETLEFYEYEEGV